MTIKQTNGKRIADYGARGREIFDDVERQINDLVAETGQIVYNGRRAKAFKTTIAQNAVEFGKAASNSMTSMSDVINQASSYVAMNLGGDSIDLDPPVLKIVMPDIVVDETIETADDAVLNGLKGTCTSIYNQVDALFDEHLKAFTDLGNEESWVGPEYDDALRQIANLTTKMRAAVDESRTEMNKAIDQQLTDLGM